MFFKNSIGIDLTASSVKIVWLKSAFTATEVKAKVTFPIRAAADLPAKISAIGETLNQFLRDNRILAPNVFAAIPRELVIIRAVTLPLAVKENLGATLQYEMEKYIPLAAEDIYFDHLILAEDKAANRLHLTLFVIKKNELAPYLELARILESGVSGIEPCSHAMANHVCDALKRKNSKDLSQRRVLVYGSDGGVEITLMVDNRLCASRILPPPVADVLPEVRQLLQSAEDFVFRPVSGVADAPYWEALTRISAEEWQEGSSIAAFKDAGIDLEYGPALGAALKGVKQGLADINFLPPRLRRKPDRTGWYALWVLAVLFMLTGLVWGGSRVVSTRLALDQHKAELRRLLGDMSRIERMQGEIQQAEARIDWLNDFQLQNIPVIELLKELTQRLPESAWISQLTFNRQKGVEIEGFAARAAELIPVLEDSPLYKDAVFISPITKDADGRERFKIGLKLK